MTLTTTIYTTIHNFARPYRVSITSDNVVRVHGGERYARHIATYNASRVFIGRSPRTAVTFVSGSHGRKYDGNSILVQLTSVKPFKYVLIGADINSFTSPAQVVSYVSPVGRSELTSPVLCLDDGRQMVVHDQHLVCGHIDPNRNFGINIGFSESRIDTLQELIGTDSMSNRNIPSLENCQGLHRPNHIGRLRIPSWPLIDTDDDKFVHLREQCTHKNRATQHTVTMSRDNYRKAVLRWGSERGMRIVKLRKVDAGMYARSSPKSLSHNS